MQILFRSLLLLSLLILPAFASAAAPTDFKSLVGSFLSIINLIIPVLFGLSFLVVLWGIANAWIIGGGDETKVKKGKDILLYGVIGLVVMSGVWGIVALFRTIL